MSKSIRRKRGRLPTKGDRLLLTFLARSKLLHDWSNGRKMRWAKDAYWYGSLDYAIEILEEVAQELINDNVQETFNHSCQPPPRKKRKAIRKGASQTTGWHGLPDYITNTYASGLSVTGDEWDD